MHIRLSTPADLPRMLHIFAAARRYMIADGNPHQWADDYPGEARLRDDIARGDSYVVCNAAGSPVATFVLREGDDPTYAHIYDGQWLSQRPYATIHRIASSGECSGIFDFVMRFALSRHASLRIDTHRDNRTMRCAVERNGFTYCGVIHCWSGDERLAYQLDL